jgi:hypothetical protein
MAQASLEPNQYLHKYPTNLVLVSRLAYTIYEDGTDRVFETSVQKNSDADDSPTRTPREMFADRGIYGCTAVAQTNPNDPWEKIHTFNTHYQHPITLVNTDHASQVPT